MYSVRGALVAEFLFFSQVIAIFKLFVHVHQRGVWLIPTLVALHKWNALWLEPEQPINIS